jgi:Holliday junction resolvasome RuvABC endonuclease subunit
MLAELRKVPVLEIHQATAKSVLGVRHKKDVARAVAILVDHAHPTKGKHAADAVAVGIAGERKWRAMMAERRSA